MEPFLYYLLRASIVIALFYGFYKLLFGKNTFHDANRFLLLSILIISTILPLLHFSILPERAASSPEISMLELSNIEFVDTIAKKQQNFTIPWVQTLSFIWIAGLLLVLVHYIIGLIKIIKIISSSEKYITDKNKTICITDSDISPFSWMKYIVLSRKDYEADINSVIICHEKAHTELYHSIDIFITNLITCLLWFNPFSWLLKFEIQSVHEYQADKEVLNNGIDTKKYQLLLIRKSVGEQKFAMANNFRQRDLHKRIKMMIKTKTNNRMKWAYTAVAPVFLLAMITLSVPKLNAQTGEDQPEKKIKVFRYDSTDSLNFDGDPSVKVKVINKTSIAENSDKVQVHILNDDGEIQPLNPLYIVDGKEISTDELNRLNPDDIYSISVLRDESATSTFGDKAKDGVISITTKNNQDRDKKEEFDQSIEVLVNSPLVVVDNVMMQEDFDINTIDVKDILNIKILKDDEAITAYGTDAGNGVIIINRKSK